MFDIPKTMRAVVYRGVNDLRLETVPVPRVGANELLVKVAVCGVCPTDIKKIQHGTVPPPRIFGHETAGTIVKIGGGNLSRVTRDASFKPGDRVALHHHVPCLDCHFCRHRAFAQCETYKRTGITAGFEPAGGGYAEYVRVMPFVLPGVVKIPAKNTFEEGAMLEPVNTILKAVERLNLLPGDNVLVAGQGPIGLMFTKILQLRGVNVLATDLMDSRLELARQFGARWVANARARNLQVAPLTPRRHRGGRDLKVAATEHSAVSAFRLPPSAFPLDAAVIAVPSDAAVHQAFQLVRGGGQILLFAHTKRAGGSSQMGVGSPKRVPGAPISHLPSPISHIDLATICVDEKDLIGSYSADVTLQKAVARLVFSRRLDVRRLITHRFPLDQTAAAVALAARPTSESLKIVVTVADW